MLEKRYTKVNAEEKETDWDKLERKEYETKLEFFTERSVKSVMDTCQEFKEIISFYGMVELNDRVKMLEIKEKKAKK